MVVVYAAATLPVNPSGANPEITQDKLWAGLELKRRYDLIETSGKCFLGRKSHLDYD